MNGNRDISRTHHLWRNVFPGDSSAEEGTEESPMKIPGVGIAVKKPRIGFFESFIKRKGIKREQVAEMFGVKKCTVDHWFQFDDCFFSYICRFAQINNLEVKYTVSHKND